ncbi:protein Mis18-alpha, partial [Cavia porcellus]|uniref:protein Mis18-alpha n=1 Tax=Cavia porcellus TaxID=10141 RepID=UPI000C87C152
TVAGAGSPFCGRECFSTSCACNHKDKRKDFSLLGRRPLEDSDRHQLQQKWMSMWSSASGDALMAETAKAQSVAEEVAEAEGPLVFLCSGCRRPLGDSLGWVVGPEDTNYIMLRCVSCNVSVDKEEKLSKWKNEYGCIVQTLYCTGCSRYLGYLYTCTPKDLDYKRNLFCLSVDAIESYTLGSSENQIVPEDKELLHLESRVEMEKSLKQMEDVLKALQTKLWEVESKLSFTNCNNRTQFRVHRSDS